MIYIYFKDNIVSLQNYLKEIFLKKRGDWSCKIKANCPLVGPGPVGKEEGDC